MAKIRVKGSVIKQDIASTLTAVAQVTEFGVSGAASETYEATTLDTSGAGKEYAATGYSEGGTLDFSLFFDPALAGHQSLTDDITTPPATDRDYSLTFADAATTEWTFTAAGIGIDVTGSMNDGLKADVSLKLTGLMAYAT